jgi:hypothetical protein
MRFAGNVAIIANALLVHQRLTPPGVFLENNTIKIFCIHALDKAGLMKPIMGQVLQLAL